MHRLRLRWNLTRSKRRELEFNEKQAEGKWLLHLVNFDFTRPARDIAVRFRLPSELRLRQADWESPDEATAEVLAATRRGDVHALILPRLNTYAFIRLKVDRI
jgi:hypothetical protein